MTRQFNLKFIFWCTTIIAICIAVLASPGSYLSSVLAVPVASISHFPFGLLAVVAMISTWQFYKTARRQGFHPGRAACTPLMLLGILLVIDFVTMRWVATFFLPENDVSSGLNLKRLFYSLGIGFVYLASIGRIWKALSVGSLPESSSNSAG